MFDVYVEESGHTIRTVIYQYDVATADEALELHEQGALAEYVWTDSEDFLDEIDQTIVDVRESKNA